MYMDTDFPPEPTNLRPRDRILARLGQIGVPENYLCHFECGLVGFIKDNACSIPQLVSAILPSDGELAEIYLKMKEGSKKASGIPSMRERFRESMVWLQWLMFKDEPTKVLKYLSEINVGQQGVCGAVWGNNDIAYRCRTCEHDPTCAICVPCFENGNHRNHDYSMIYTGGGCCDCGDVTAWKREGFCSKHKGTEQIQPLPEEIVNSAEPVLDALMVFWKNKLLAAESFSQEGSRASGYASECRKVANELSVVVLEMLIQFCKHSESLLSFASIRIFCSAGLLEILVRAERFSSEAVVKKLHELLLKLLAEPSFKYEFAKAFLSYYPVVVKEAVKECNDDEFSKKHTALSTFSVQIFTVPTLTPRLVKEMSLLEMLLGCLEDIFTASAGDDGCLQVAKWQSLYETTIRVAVDIQFVMSHAVVQKYVINERRDILRTWMRLLTFVQGVNPQRRETDILLEEEIESTHLPFALCYSIANIHSLLVDGASSNAPSEGTNDFSEIDTTDMGYTDSLRHAKVGRLSQESSACSTSGRSSAAACESMAAEFESSASNRSTIPSSITWLVNECLKAIENWLLVDKTLETPAIDLSERNTSIAASNFSAWKTKILSIGKGKDIFRRLSRPIDRQLFLNASLDNGEGAEQEFKAINMVESDLGNASFVVPDNFTAKSDCSSDMDTLHILSLQDWPSIVYDVSSQDISVHIPLHRLLSLLLLKALRSCAGESTVLKGNIASFAHQSPATYAKFFNDLLGCCSPLGFSSFIMEHPLRIRVFCAQVHAGMWKKNGEAAILSCDWYRSARGSEQGLELDLFLMQCCAALAPADLFVSRILERFGLLSYLSLNPAPINEYEAVLVQEMLTLVTQLVKERRFCGQTTAESLKRELVYKLATGDATRSQLVKSLPRDLAKFEGLQDVLDTVASYSNPSGFNQGMYSLRWPYWKELDLYHPRWNSRDLQIAEERYARFCSVSALTSQLPKWAPLYAPFSGIARIATCRVTLQIIRAVLYYAVFSDKATESRAPDSVLIIALHLLSLALDVSFQQRDLEDRTSSAEPNFMLAFAAEEVSEGSSRGVGKLSLLSLLVLLRKLHKKAGNLQDAYSLDLSPLIESLLKKFAEIDSHCMRVLQQLAPDLVSQVYQSALDSDVSNSGLASEGDRHRARVRERQAAIMARMKAEQSKFLASISADESLSSGEEETPVLNESQESVQDVCSLCHDSDPKNPLSFLILLQKSRLLSLLDRGPPSWAKVQQLEKESMQTEKNKEHDPVGVTTSSSGSEVVSPSKLVQLVQNMINKFMHSAQPSEVNAFLEFVVARFPSLRNLQLPNILNDKKETSADKFETLEEDMYQAVRRTLYSNECLSNSSMEDTRISAAQEVAGNVEDAETILMAKYIAFLSRERAENPSASENFHIDEALEENTKGVSGYDGFGPVDCDGIFLSSCGHAVHQGCLDRYLSSLKERYIRRIIFEGGHIVDLDQGEFLCPVCRRLANSVLPSLPGVEQMMGKQSTSSAFISSECLWPGASSDASSFLLPQALSLLQTTADIVKKGEIFNALSLRSNTGLRLKLESFFGVLSKMYFPGKQERSSRSSRTGFSVIMWDTLRYSLISTEISARSGKTSFIPNVSLNALFKELASSGKLVLSLFLRIIQSMRNKDTVDVLHRFRGIRLFANSICSGISTDHRSSSDAQEGSIFCILEDSKKGAPYPDVQFWKRAADPVLAHDPFSSLMWVLFCLPAPFIFCAESFLSLVHIFYVVSVAQAIICYFSKRLGEMDDLGFSDCLITDISKFMREFGLNCDYVTCNHVDSSWGIDNVVRSLSMPYLRRCALLWKLLNSSSAASFLDIHESEGPSHVIHDSTNLLMELSEIQELEKMFMIPSLHNIYRDEKLRHLVLCWIQHLCKENELHRVDCIMHCTPMVPFKLIQLPHLYQDLLQRYIKQQCPDCNAVPEEPALCLLCGRLCSPSWKSCCRASGCQSHAFVCGAGTGVFLLIKRTMILLQRSARQALWPSPYLDAFGEEDIGLHRGKPLYLNEERYAALTYMVTSHGLDRSSKVLRQTTIGFVGNGTWT